MIITLTGKNEFMVAQQLNELISKQRETDGESSVNIMLGDEVDFDRLSEAILSVSLLSPSNTVVLKEISPRKDLHEQFIELLEKVPESVSFIIADTKLDKRTALYKVLKSTSDFREYSQLDERQLTDWIIERFDSKIDRTVAAHLARRVGEDQWRLNSEIDKLLNFDEPVTQSLINDVVEPHPRETIFELLDSVAQNNQAQALKLYNSLLITQMEPMYILSMLIWQLHNLNIVVSAGDKSDNQIISDHSMSPYVLSKTKNSARNLNKSKIKKMWEEVLSVDSKIKSSSVNDEQVIEQLIVKLTTS